MGWKCFCFNVGQRNEMVTGDGGRRSCRGNTLDAADRFPSGLVKMLHQLTDLPTTGRIRILNLTSCFTLSWWSERWTEVTWRITQTHISCKTFCNEILLNRPSCKNETSVLVSMFGLDVTSWVFGQMIIFLLWPQWWQNIPASGFDQNPPHGKKHWFL